MLKGNPRSGIIYKIYRFREAKRAGEKKRRLTETSTAQRENLQDQQDLAKRSEQEIKDKPRQIPARAGEKK